MATFPDQLSLTFKDFFQSLQAATPKSSATAARAKVPCCCWDPVFGKHSNIAGWSPSIILMLFPHTKAGYKWEILGVDMVLDGNGYQLQSICYDLLQWPEQIIDLLTSKMLCQEKIGMSHWPPDSWVFTGKKICGLKNGFPNERSPTVDKCSDFTTDP